MKWWNCECPFCTMMCKTGEVDCEAYEECKAMLEHWKIIKQKIKEKEDE